MKPAPFDYMRVDTLPEALAVLGQYGDDAKVLAGGQSLVPMLNMRLLKPSVIVDISQLAALTKVVENDSYIEVGASVTQSIFETYLNNTTDYGLLRQALPWIGHYQTRQTGTVCGSLVHSDPSSELPLCLKLLGGEVVIQSAKKKRISPAASFQIGLLETDVASDEIVTSVRFPKASKSSQFAFREISQRHGDFAIVAMAVEANNTMLKIGVGGVADVPTIKILSARSDGDIEDELNEFAWELGAYDDVHATARYRRELVRRMGKSLINEVLS